MIRSYEVLTRSHEQFSPLLRDARWVHAEPVRHKPSSGPSPFIRYCHVGQGDRKGVKVKLRPIY